VSGRSCWLSKPRKPSAIGQAESQLLTYLSTVRALRRQHGKINMTAQGFYSDGLQYRFLSIDEEGLVYISRTYDSALSGDLRTIYNWIVTMLETATCSSPTTTPLKPGKERDEEIGQFKEKVFLRFYQAGQDESDTLFVGRCGSGPGRTKYDIG
jgi:hypothetical protein